MKRHIAWIVLLACSITGTAALADDGGISMGGSPKLLRGHASVAMKREVVKMDIAEDTIKVDCTFWFHNSGPAATVRMGFPDEGQGAAIPYEGEPLPTKNLHATFTSYHSWVDGKKVQTKLVPTNDRSIFWHTKTVHFKGFGDTIIRDVYTLPPGAQVTNENGMYQQTCYILHTGASWHGPIGQGEVTINMTPQAVRAPKSACLHLLTTKQLPTHNPYDTKWSALPAGAVVYSAPVAPVQVGNTLRFSFSSLKPSKKDDIHLYYGYRKLPDIESPPARP